MNALEFADTNIVVYAVGHPSERQAKARAILAEGLTVSSQVINETVSVLSRKQGVSLAVAHEVAESLLELCQVAPVNGQTIRKAIGLTRRHQLSHWDSLIVAAALLAGCEILYSQDMQHGQVFDGQLKVVNPFV
ncbi:PIN domain-containing protein [Methylovulum psychrotolerans]|uniref:VapC toxin family PIN domain ribonuclease n=1 Tax=Methylovulum psychrotolerans TaxID=1704499 RepID=A0A1Z4BUQ1_9GAMM|nr:PIN domain-containing protein [Methylovulum psychrotolerans]ASF44988.1 VapC toxin family PIN domain ribonuclease [Methylovulum psychrotolerans]